MAAVDLSNRAKEDLERLFDFLAETDPRHANDACTSILEAFEILQRHPLIGSPVDDDQRKLVISCGQAGYVALYHYDEAAGDASDALITTIRHQRESGFGD